MKNQKLSRLRRVTAAVAASFMLLLGGTTAAHASTFSSTVTDLKVEKLAGGADEALTQYDTLKFSGKWSATDPKNGDSFKIELPAELSFNGDMDFDLLKDGVTVANCNAPGGPASTLTCTFNAEIERLGSSNGDFWVEMSAYAATDAEYLVAKIDGQPVNIPLPGGGGIEGVEATDPNLDEISKYGSQDGSRFVWTITVPSGTAASVLRIDDAMANTSPHEWHFFDESEAPRLFERATVSAGGDWAPGSTWSQVDSSKFTLTPTSDKSGFNFSMTSDPSMAYQLTYFTKPSGIVIPGDTFSNDATINGTSVSSDSVEYRQTGGGGTEGSPFGRFSVRKSIADNEGKVPAGTEFSVRYTIGDEISDMTVTLDGDAVTSPRLAPGTVVKIEEISLPEIADIKWGTPVFTLDGTPVSTFSVVAGQTLEISLVNSFEAAEPEEPGNENPDEPGNENPDNPDSEEPVKPGKDEPSKPGSKAPGVPKEALAATGSQGAPPVALLAGILLLLGAGVMLARRKTQS